MAKVPVPDKRFKVLCAKHKPKSEVPRDPDAPRMTGKEAMASGLDPGEIVDCAHQVLLRLYMLDAGLNYR